MKSSDFRRYALGTGVAAALLAGCGGSQQTIGALGTMHQSVGTDRRGSPSSYAVLYRFNVAPDGHHPYAGLVNVNGTLYGTTFWGGAGVGTVYSITTGGTEQVLYRFAGKSDGTEPYAGLIDINGTLYGTTYAGGGYGCLGGGCGTIYSITTDGTEKVLYSFGGGSDGNYPGAGLTEVNGTLYGTTMAGGSGCNSDGCGTVFSATTGGREHVLHSFGKGSDGASPSAGLVFFRSTLYGTTNYGGKIRCSGGEGCGTVFSITPSGKEKVLHSFGRGADGANPRAGLIAVNGTLYGTTTTGGAFDAGTVFSITKGGTEKVLYSFGGGTDGNYPGAALVDVNATLYGTTIAGGASNAGTVFSITTSGTEQVLHSFGGKADGAGPSAGLIYLNGTLYGTTYGGGLHRRNAGTVFALTL